MRFKIQKAVRRLNKLLKVDVFDGRFEIKEMKKSRVDGIWYFMYKIIDNEDKTRVGYTNWISEFSIRGHEVFELANDFIIRSNFWAGYHNDLDRYIEKEDIYKRG